jgi:hypothetical protein
MVNEIQTAFTYGEVDVPFDKNRLISLTEMWRSVGSPENKNPNDWSRTDQGKAFIDGLAKDLNTARNRIWIGKRGKDGGTWGHWQIACAYAQYLSPEYHRYVNEAFKEWAEEKADPGLKAERAVEGMRKKGWDEAKCQARILGIFARNIFTKTLASHGVKQPGGFDRITAGMAIKLDGATPSKQREIKGLKKSASLRDTYSTKQLAAWMLSEAMATESIEETRAVGNEECYKVSVHAADCVRLSIEGMKKDTN